MRAKLALCAALLPLLSACGGGGGSSATATPNADPQGFWQGTTSNGHNVATLVLETGQYYAVYSANNVVDGLIEGNLAVSGNNITDNSSVDLAIGVGVIPAKLTGTVTTRQSISGTFSEPSASITFNGTYNASYDTAANLSQAVGTWTGQTTGTTLQTTLTVGSNGAFTGSSGTCTFSGSVAPRASGKGVFDGSVTFNDASCQLGAGATVSFEAVISGAQLIAAGVNSARNNGFIFLGNKS